MEPELTRDEVKQVLSQFADRIEADYPFISCVLGVLCGALIMENEMALSAHIMPFVQAEIKRLEKLRQVQND